MDSLKLIDRFVNKSDIEFLGSRVRKTLLRIDGVKKYIHTVTDFPITDPWSEAGLRPAISKLRKKGFFKGAVMELGIGDGRNIFVAGKKITEVIGIDLEEWRLSIAKYNFENDRFLANIPIHLYKADAVFFIDKLTEKVKKGTIARMPERVIMILPQSLGGKNLADRYKHHKSYKIFEKKWGQYGFTLNAAVLSKLSKKLPKSAEIVTVLSGRIPLEITLKMISDTGWKIAETVNDVVVQQDPDTFLNWMDGNVPDDGTLFQEKSGRNISLKEAIKRIRKSGGDRKRLDVYHRLYVYRLRKK